jgi:hypothetical protein
MNSYEFSFNIECEKVKKRSCAYRMIVRASSIDDGWEKAKATLQKRPNYTGKLFEYELELIHFASPLPSPSTSPSSSFLDDQRSAMWAPRGSQDGFY